MANQRNSTPETTSRGRGRPRLNNAESLRQVWEFVRSGCMLSGQSVHRFCSRVGFNFSVVGNTDRRRVRTLEGATLERCYYEAVKFRQEHIDDHAESLAFFASIGATAGLLNDICGLEKFWNAQLQETLDENRPWRISAQLGSITAQH